MHADRAQCPTENTVVELLEAGLAPERRAVVGEHVDHCASCRELVAVMARSQLTGSGMGRRMRFARASEQEAEQGGPLRAGEQLGRYRVEELIGQGAMGAVYAARDPELDRRVAVKVIRPGLAGYSDLVAARLSREARAMAQVAHPNVVAVHDVGHAGGQVFVAMELAAGQTLREWLAAGPRSWRDVVDVFRGAGEGLAAAHAAQLVHRDFKPDNVLVDAAGRARVTDFGLARALARPDVEPRADTGAPDRDGERAEAASDGAVGLTRTGATVGTPAYMAPEQHAHLPTDERSDQFSFCVALWEALFGQRPFPGATALELAEAVVRGRRRPVPSRPRLPAWLRRALVRGLSLRPGDRFPSMRALLDALRPRPRRLVIAAALALAAGGGAVAFAALPTDDPAAQPDCSGGEGRLAAVWNDGRRSELRARLVQPGNPQTEVRWGLVDQALGRYARGWLRMHADTCAAAARGGQSPELLDLRSHCLDTRLADLQQVTALLDTADPLVAAGAVESIGALPPIERCSTVEVVEARTPVPADPSQRAEVEELRRELVRADALRLAGRYAEARAHLETLRARAEATGYRPLVADVLYFLGELETSTGSAAEGEATLRRAAHTAEAGRYDQLAADTWILLIETASQGTGNLEKAAEYAEHARAALDRLGRHTRLEAQYEQHMGILDWARSRHADALAHFTAARRLFGQVGDAEGMGGADEGMALVYEDQGKLEEALRLTRGVMAAREQRLGRDHPHTALAANNVASALMMMGRYQEALDAMNRALAIRQRANGPEHIETAQALHNIGELLRNLGRYQEALDHHRRSLAVFEREFGADHQLVATSLENTGGVYLDLGQVEEALPRLRRALDIHLRTLGDAHVDTVRGRINLADGLRSSSRFAEALEHDRAALAALSGGIGVENLYGAHARFGAGLDLVGLGRLADARDPLERAMATLQRIGGDPFALAQAQFGLARSLWPDPGARSRALELARAAHAALDGASGADARLRVRVAAWLDARSR